MIMNEKRRMTLLRNKELLRDYREKLHEAFESDKPLNRKEIVRLVLLEGKPHYYVCFDHAYNIMMKLNTTGKVSKKTLLKQQMWKEIHEKVKKMMSDNPGLAMHNALARVLVTERASRYYISEVYAYRYLYKLCHENLGNRHDCGIGRVVPHQ